MTMDILNDDMEKLIGLSGTITEIKWGLAKIKEWWWPLNGFRLEIPEQLKEYI